MRKTKAENVVNRNLKNRVYIFWIVFKHRGHSKEVICRGLRPSPPNEYHMYITSHNLMANFQPIIIIFYRHIFIMFIIIFHHHIIFIAFINIFYYHNYYRIHYILLQQLHKDVASNIKQVLVTTPHKAPTIRPPAFHHENYPGTQDTAGWAETSSLVMYSYGPPLMAEQKQDDQLEHTYSSYVKIRDVVQKTGMRRWTIGKSGERGSGISVQAARHDDDDDDDFTVYLISFSYFYFLYLLYFIVIFLSYFIIMFYDPI